MAPNLFYYLLSVPQKFYSKQAVSVLPQTVYRNQIITTFNSLNSMAAQVAFYLQLENSSALLVSGHPSGQRNRVTQ
jgi:hypothetical protein